jgi:hypothetical protein
MIAGAGHDVDFTGADIANVAFQGPVKRMKVAV